MIAYGWQNIFQESVAYWYLKSTNRNTLYTRISADHRLLLIFSPMCFSPGSSSSLSYKEDALGVWELTQLV